MPSQSSTNINTCRVQKSTAIISFENLGPNSSQNSSFFWEILHVTLGADLNPNFGWGPSTLTYPNHHVIEVAKPWVPDKGIQIGWSNTDDEKQEELKISWMFSLWPGPLRPGPSFTTRLITIYHQRPPSRPQSWWTISTYWNTLACSWSEKKIVNLEDQFPSPPTHNPDEQFINIGTKLWISKGTILPVEKSRWRTLYCRPRSNNTIFFNENYDMGPQCC